MGVQSAMSPTADRWGPVTWEQISHWGFKQGQHFNGMEVVEGRWKWVKRKWEMKISISKDNHFKLFFEGEWIHWREKGKKREGRRERNKGRKGEGVERRKEGWRSEEDK